MKWMFPLLRAKQTPFVVTVGRWKTLGIGWYGPIEMTWTELCAQNKYVPTSFKKHLVSDPRCHSSESSHPRLGSATTDSLGLHILKTWGEGPMETSTVVARSEHQDGARVWWSQCWPWPSPSRSFLCFFSQCKCPEARTDDPLLTFSELMERLSTSHKAWHYLQLLILHWWFFTFWGSQTL